MDKNLGRKLQRAAVREGRPGPSLGFWGTILGELSGTRRAAESHCAHRLLASLTHVGAVSPAEGQLGGSGSDDRWAAASGSRPYRTKEKSFGACTGTWASISPAVEKPSGSALEVYLVGSAVMAGTFSDPVPGQHGQAITARPPRCQVPCTSLLLIPVHCYSGAAHLQMAARL